MARREDIQYVRYYAYGSAAPRIHSEPDKLAGRQADPIPEEQRKTILFDPVAIIGTAIAAVMILCVIIGFCQLNGSNNEIQAMENYISDLNSDNYALNREYSSGYDLEQIRTAAEGMGLVPVEQVEHITIHIPEPEVEVELPWWEQIWNDFLSMIE